MKTLSCDCLNFMVWGIKKIPSVPNLKWYQSEFWTCCTSKEMSQCPFCPFLAPLFYFVKKCLGVQTYCRPLLQCAGRYTFILNRMVKWWAGKILNFCFVNVKKNLQKSKTNNGIGRFWDTNYFHILYFAFNPFVPTEDLNL